MPDDEQKKSFRWIPAFIRHDFVRKAIALFFACLVYAIVAYKVGGTVNIPSVPVIIEMPAGLVNKDTTIPKVKVYLRGSKRTLSNITAADLSIKVRVEENKYLPGAPYALKINLDNIDTPAGSRAVNVIPDEFKLLLEERIPKEVEIKARFNSERNLPPDFAVGKVRLSPATAIIKGPKSVIDETREIFTQPIPLDRSTIESFEYQVRLADNHPGISVSPDKVTAEVEIVRQYGSATFKSLPIRILEASGNDKLRFELLTSPHADITLSGVKDKIARLKPELIKPYIDISGLDKPGNYMADVRCWVDFPAIEILNVYPRQVQVKITTR